MQTNEIMTDRYGLIVKRFEKTAYPGAFWGTVLYSENAEDIGKSFTFSKIDFKPHTGQRFWENKFKVGDFVKSIRTGLIVQIYEIDYSNNEFKGPILHSGNSAYAKGENTFTWFINKFELYTGPAFWQMKFKKGDIAVRDSLFLEVVSCTEKKFTGTVLHDKSGSYKKGLTSDWDSRHYKIYIGPAFWEKQFKVGDIVNLEGLFLEVKKVGFKTYICQVLYDRSNTYFKGYTNLWSLDDVKLYNDHKFWEVAQTFTLDQVKVMLNKAARFGERANINGHGPLTNDSVNYFIDQLIKLTK